MKSRILIICLFLPIFWACDNLSQISGSVQPPGPGNNPLDGIPLGSLRLQLQFVDLVGTTLTVIPNPTDVQRVRFSLALAQGNELLGPSEQPLSALTPVQTRGEARQISFSRRSLDDGDDASR